MERARLGSPAIDIAQLRASFQVEEGGNYVIRDGPREFLMKCTDVHHGDEIDLQIQTLAPTYEVTDLKDIKRGVPFAVTVGGRDYIGNVEAVANARNRPDLAYLNLRRSK